MSSPALCEVCRREHERMNSDVAECSHVDCPHRRRAWSDRPSRSDLFKGPYPKAKSADPKPVDVELKKNLGTAARPIESGIERDS